mgnify:FL=1
MKPFVARALVDLIVAVVETAGNKGFTIKYDHGKNKEEQALFFFEEVEICRTNPEWVALAFSSAYFERIREDGEEGKRITVCYAAESAFRLLREVVGKIAKVEQFSYRYDGNQPVDKQIGLFNGNDKSFWQMSMNLLNLLRECGYVERVRVKGNLTHYEPTAKARETVL